MKKVIVAAMLFLMPGAALAYDCWDYANRAVRQQRANVWLPCGYGGARWQDNWQAHFDWCSVVPIATAAAEDVARQNGLKSCLNRAAYVDDCDYYASRAVRQFRANEAMACGFSGPRWQANLAAHKNWCLNVTYAAINQEDQARRNSLLLCVNR